MMAGMDLGQVPGQRSTQMPGIKPPASPALFPAAQPPASLDRGATATPGSPPGSAGSVAVNPSLTPAQLTAPTVPPPRQLTPDQQRALDYQQQDIARRAAELAANPQPAPMRLPVEMPTSLPGPVRQPVDMTGIQLLPGGGPAMTTSPITVRDRPLTTGLPDFPDQFMTIQNEMDQQRNAMAAAVERAQAPPIRPPVQMPTSLPAAPITPPAPPPPAPVAAPALMPAPTALATTQPVQPVRQAPQIGGHPIQQLLRRYRSGIGGPVIGGRRLSGML